MQSWQTAGLTTTHHQQTTNKSVGTDHQKVDILNFNSLDFHLVDASRVWMVVESLDMLLDRPTRAHILISANLTVQVLVCNTYNSPPQVLAVVFWHLPRQLKYHERHRQIISCNGVRGFVLRMAYILIPSNIMNCTQFLTYKTISTSPAIPLASS